MEKKTIGVSLLSCIIGSLLMLGGVQLTDDNVYYCEDRGIVLQCDKLSKYYSLPNGKCWNSEVGNKLCRSGWLEVVDDSEVSTCPKKQNTKRWLCSPKSPKGCPAE